MVDLNNWENEGGSGPIPYPEHWECDLFPENACDSCRGQLKLFDILPNGEIDYEPEQ